MKLMSLWDWRKEARKQKREYKRLQKNYLAYREKVIAYTVELEVQLHTLQQQIELGAK